MAEKYIDQKEAIQVIQDILNHYHKTYVSNARAETAEWCLKKLKDLPAADVVEVVRGKWEDVHFDRPEIADIEVASMFCPKCNRWHNEVYHYGNPIEFVNFCSFCGADMRDGDGE